MSNTAENCSLESIIETWERKMNKLKTMLLELVLEDDYSGARALSQDIKNITLVYGETIRVFIRHEVTYMIILYSIHILYVLFIFRSTITCMEIKFSIQWKKIYKLYIKKNINVVLMKSVNRQLALYRNITNLQYSKYMIIK